MEVIRTLIPGTGEPGTMWPSTDHDCCACATAMTRSAASGLLPSNSSSTNTLWYGRPTPTPTGSTRTATCTCVLATRRLSYAPASRPAAGAGCRSRNYGSCRSPRSRNWGWRRGSCRSITSCTYGHMSITRQTCLDIYRNVYIKMNRIITSYAAGRLRCTSGRSNA